MPAPLIRRYFVAPTTANTFFAICPAVPTGRALVISKLMVANLIGTSVTTIFATIRAGTPSGDPLPPHIVMGYPLQPSEVYVESSGMTVLAGEQVWAYSSLANSAGFQLFGQEIDNV